jgi:hypothetical protein
VVEFDPRGNPVYDWAKARQIVPPDASPVKFFPLMAVRAEDLRAGCNRAGTASKWF